MDKIHYDKIKDKLNSYKITRTSIRQGVKIIVYESDEFYYKIWPSTWYKRNVVEAAVDNGFYDEKTTPVLKSLIYDDTGGRGYITKKGKQFLGSKSSDWSEFVEKTTNKQRKQFMLDVLSKSWEVKGIYTDIQPSNLVVYNKQISFIDLDSYNSYAFIFHNNPDSYEKPVYKETSYREIFKKKMVLFEQDVDVDGDWEFDLQKVAQEDIDLLYRDYLRFCLDIRYDKHINNEYTILEMLGLIKTKKSGFLPW